MSPQELRAFRESLGLSRREFAPRLFISEPTLERWERGQGGPREIHLRILRRMRKRLRAGNATAYFQYDAAGDVVNPSQECRQIVIEALKAAGAVLCEEKDSADGSTWLLRFSLDWAPGESIGASLTCEGSYKFERPSIDFALEVVCDSASVQSAAEELTEACLTHGIAWGPLRDVKRRSGLVLRQRTFNSACDAETIQHVLGNLRSCWDRMNERLRAGGPPQRSSRKNRKKMSGVNAR